LAQSEGHDAPRLIDKLFQASQQWSTRSSYDLKKPDAADLGRRGARRTVIGCRKRPNASPGQTAQLCRIKILA
jgi:hypothetical protein